MGTIGQTKIPGRMGAKKHLHFCKSTSGQIQLETNHHKQPLDTVVTQKYILPGTIEDWIRRSNKTTSNCSIIWKAIIKSFHVIGDGLAWKIRKGEKLRLGSDPWPGSGTAHTLSQELQDHLHAQGLYKLSQIVDPSTTDIWHQGWLTAETLGLNGELKQQWEIYLFTLPRSNIRLLDSEDEMVW
jgi:hypothetical protein